VLFTNILDSLTAPCLVYNTAMYRYTVYGRCGQYDRCMFIRWPVWPVRALYGPVLDVTPTARLEFYPAISHTAIRQATTRPVKSAMVGGQNIYRHPCCYTSSTIHIATPFTLHNVCTQICANVNTEFTKSYSSSSPHINSSSSTSDILTKIVS